jgi:NADPH:quinone reductase-like Zn-dependent oxidoreductase
MKSPKPVRPANAPPLRADATTMSAMVQDQYGEAEDVLKLEYIPRPTVGEDDVLIRVHAAGVDRGAWHLMTGLPYPVRLVAGMRMPRTRGRGMELAGRVVALGPGVTGIEIGDEVFGVGDATFAEYALAKPGMIAPKPAGLSFEQAAAVGVSACTALQAVRNHGRVQPGQRVLVLGASGGVGTFAVQIAKAFGGIVTGVCTTSKVELVRSLGADHVIDYTLNDVTDGSRQYDVILDVGGNRSLGGLRSALSARGTLVIIGGETSGRWLAGSDRQLRAMALSPFIGQSLRTFVGTQSTGDLIALTQLIATGAVTPVIDRTYPLAEVPAAVRHLQDGHARGKVVITV